MIDHLPLGWAGRLALQRLGAQWRSLLTVIAGTLLSASVGALIPLYTTAVAQVSMVERFNQLPAEEVNAFASLALVPAQQLDQSFTQAVAQFDLQFRALVDRYISVNFPGWLNRAIFYGETSALSINPPAVVPEPGAEPRIPDPTTRVFVAFYQDWQAAVTVLAGRLPNDSPADADADIEIVIPFDAQNTLGVNVEDVLILDQGGPRGGWPTSKNVRARVVGVVAMPDQLTGPERAYFIPPSPVRYTQTRGEFQAEYAVLTTRAAFEWVATGFVPDTPTRFGWRLLFDHARLPFSRSPDARAALLDFQNALIKAFRTDQESDIGLIYRTRLIDFQQQGDRQVDEGVLLDYERNVRSLDAPFGLLLLQVGALVIFYLMVTAALVRRGERREIALLQSRGAADGAITLVRGLEALAICCLAAITAPLLAQQLLIAITPFFARYPNLPLLLTPSVFIYSIVAALAAFIALMVTLRPVLRMPLITSGGATLRGEPQPWWQRYYLDVLLVILGVAALLRLVNRDTPLFTTSAGGSATDPFLLLAPAFLFLGLGSVLLRLFPAIASAVARALSSGRGLVGPMATWQLSREPLHYGRITFLLALAIGVGWFATSFRATLDRSQTDQAAYRVGTDARFAERDILLNAERARPLEAYTSLPGVEAASVAWRRPFVNYQPDPTKQGVAGALLAIDSDTFAPAASLRADLGAIRTPRAPGDPVKLPERGGALPFVPEKLGLWAKFDVPNGFGGYAPDLDRLRNRVPLFARLLDGSGAWVNVRFALAETEYLPTGPQSPGLDGGGSFVSNGWAYFEADLAALNYKLAEPVRLVSIYWGHRARNQQGERFLSLQLAGLTATDSGGARHSLNLLSQAGWDFAYDSGAYSEGRVTQGFTDPRRGIGIAALWDQFAESTRIGVLFNYPAVESVPMIASEGLVAALGLQPGQALTVRNLEQSVVTFEVLPGAQRYYPSLYDALKRGTGYISEGDNQPFAVVDRDSLLYVLNRRPSAAVYANEVWLNVAPGVDPDALLRAARPEGVTFLSVQTLPGELANLQTDPLSRGLLGLMFLAFIVAMALSIVGLLTYSALTATARRSEFGVLRALGLSSLRVIVQLGVEQLFVILLGVLLGGALGALLSTQVVPRLAQDTRGTQITPPFVVQVETAALAQYSAVIALVILVVMILSLILVRGLSLSRTLRLGEE